MIREQTGSLRSEQSLSLWRSWQYYRIAKSRVSTGTPQTSGVYLLYLSVVLFVVIGAPLASALVGFVQVLSPVFAGWNVLDRGLPVLLAGAFFSVTYLGSVIGPARPLGSFARFQLELPFSRASVLWPGVAVCNTFALAMAIMTALVGASNLTTESINLLGLALGSAALVKLLTTHWLWGQCQGGYRRWVLPAITSAAILLGHWIVISSGLDWTLELLASNFAAMVLATLILVLCAVDVWILHSCDIHVMIHRSQQSSASYAFLYTGNFLDAAASLKATPTVLRRLPVLTYSFGFSLLARLLRTPARSAIGILWLTVLIVLFTVLSQLTADPVTGTFLLLGFYSASGIFFDVSRSEIESGGSISPFAESTSRRLFRSFLPAAIFLLIFSIAIPFLSSLSPLPMVFPLLLALSARLYQLSKARQDGTDTMVGLGGEMGAFLLVWKAIDSYAYFCALALIYLQGGPTLVLIALLFCGLLAWRGIVKIQRIG